MKRTIFLVDMNAFFISCEMSRNPELKGRPAAVAGDPKKRSGIILAANYEARKFGIKTTMVLHEARKLCPSLALVPPDHAFYSMKSREVMRILSGYTPVVEQNSIDEAWLDLTGCEGLFGSPLAIAGKIMHQIQEELDLWCSIGISENKFLAKMASEIKKPRGITELWVQDIRQKLWPLPIRDMYGIGRQTEARLRSMAIETIGDLAKYSSALLSKRFGKLGEEMHRLANGIDTAPVMSEHPGEMKSVSRSTTLSEDITDLEYAKKVLLQLSEEVGAEARKYDKKGRTVAITIKYNDFQSLTRQKTVAPTYLTRDIYLAGVGLLEAVWNKNRPVRLLGIGIGGFTEEHAVQQITLFEWANQEPVSVKAREEKLEKALDAIREKHGRTAISRAALIRNGGRDKLI